MDALTSIFLPIESLATVLLAAATYNLARQTTILRKKDILNSKIDEVKRASCSSDAWTSEAIEQSEANRKLLTRLIEIKGKNQLLTKVTPTTAKNENAEALEQEQRAKDEYNASVDSNAKLNDKLFEVLTQLSGIDPLIDSIGDAELISLNKEFNRLYEVCSAQTKTSNAIDLTSLPELEKLKINLQEIDMTIDYYKKRKEVLVKMVSLLVLLKQ